MSQKLAVVVTGGTGKQGGAVVKSLLERGHEVRAVTRSTDSAKARELANAGVTLVRASLEDTAALTKALEGATSLFAMTTPFEEGTQAETRQGMSAADAAKAAGVHLVFTSVGSANRQTGIPHFDSKYEVEEHIAKIGVRATVLAPVYFMENLHFGKEQLAKGIYATPLPPTRQLAQVAVADIGAVAVRLLEDPGRFTRKRFDLGSDELTGHDVVAIDSDPDALNNARDNIARNGAAPSIDIIRDDVATLRIERADVVLANLTGAVLVRYAAELRNLARDGGYFVLSGFAPQDAAVIRTAFGHLGVVDEKGEGDWAAICLRL